MNSANNRRSVITLLIEHKEALPDQLCDELATKAYNLIAIYGKTADVTAQICQLPPQPWEMSE